MNRRSFFGKVLAGLAVASVSVDVVAAHGSASAYLTQAYNKYAKGTSRGPKTLLVSQELYDAFSAELKANVRLVDVWQNAQPPYKRLVFKATTMMVSKQLTGWQYVFGG